MKIGIVGGGATGLTAGYELTKLGHQVFIFESQPECGGLVSTFNLGSQELERFYHHIFTSDSDLIALIDELGLSSDLLWLTPQNGIFANDKLYPFTSPRDLLLFKELSFTERIALGLMVLRAKTIKDWSRLEQYTAKEWIVKNAGQNVYDKLWGPLLSSKFDQDAENISGTWLWNKFKLRGSTRGKNINQELLGYLTGSFGRVYQTLANRIVAAGGVIHCQKPVRRIVANPSGTLRISAGDLQVDCDRVIETIAPEHLKSLAPALPSEYLERIQKIKYKANICMVLELSEPLSPYYWISMAQSGFPFVAIIEHTNLVPLQYPCPIVYLSRYLDAGDELYLATDSTIQEQFFKGLKRVFPGWNEHCVKNLWINRARYTQPVVKTYYSQIKPAYQTPIDNLFLASMAQIYPEDRGQNYAVRMGKEIARIINSQSKSNPQ